MSRFRRCFLHIGFEKTGSTSVQAFLTDHADILRQKGYLVPRSLARTDGFCNHTRLTAYTLGDEDHTFIDDVRIHHGVTDRGRIDSFRRETAELLGQEAAQNQDCRQLVLSNEHLSSRIGTVAEIIRLKTFLDGFCETVTVIAYLRRQTDVLQSAYNEAVKAGFHDIDLFPDFSAPQSGRWIEQRYFEYGTVLDLWAEVFGLDNMVVKLFDREALLFGDVVQDFLFSIHIDPSKFRNFPRLNEGLDRRAQIFLQHLNGPLSRMDPKQAAQIRDRLSAILMEKARGKGRRLTAQQASTFLLQFEAENERVRQKWFPTRATLFGLPKCPEEANDSSSGDITLADAFAIMASVLHELVRAS